ncbi:PREDICTED: kinesin-like protein KIF19 isoform X2 [Nicrophorus vespilloides]|uniref:Kinesin-like protein n=1 Tax=Nicrophorus vespilloides TaxID=110193 RepID=A0ABM1NDR3_NICVS|nr:PREDICTED: kinesin-like protein KIF19 isoform X2 [Nicrophorus vespilloides]
MASNPPSSSDSDSSRKPPTGSVQERLMVAVRIRPLKTDENQRVLFTTNNKNVIIGDYADKNDVLRQKRGSDKQYSFDVVFGEDSTQEEVYEKTTGSLVKDILNGYNATVFAYGATGAGKTHTMVGDPSQPGIMIRALNDLFNAVKDKQDQYSVTMSYLEIYNEQIRDLLNPGSGYLELREDARGRSIQVAGLTEISTNSTNDVMVLLQKGNKARTVEPTAMNKTSSRSHALLSVTVKQTIPIDKRDHLRMRVKQGRLFMIDLAGSERANKTKNRGKRLQEGAHINRSLLALGNCINALSGGARYVNYRDSKLTRLLKEALSGNCRTVMIAHVSPSGNQKDESRNTLIYADRANHISNKVERNVLDVNYHVNQYQTVITELRGEIVRLQQKMTEERPRSADIKLNAEQRSAEVKNIREQIVETFKTQMKLRRKLMEIDSHLLGIGMEAERQHLVISNWESRNNKLYKNNLNMSRAQTQQSLRRKRTVTADSFHSADNEDSSDLDAETEGEVAVQHAWGELADIEREQERWSELRTTIEQKLEVCRQRGVSLEDKLPALLSSDDEREILALMCRVHELEADKMALQSERLVRQHELRRRDLVILRYDRQRQLCEEIITRQRQLMEDGQLKLPLDLQELYLIYQQEIHASTYADYSISSLMTPDSKLPPISKIYSDPMFRRGTAAGSSPPSSAESDADPLPSLNDPSVDRVMGHPVSRPGLGMKLPPLPPSPPIRISRTANSSSSSNNNLGHMRRAMSENILNEDIME